MVRRLGSRRTAVLLLDGDDSKWCGTRRQGEWRSRKLGQRAPAHREGADGIECRVDGVDIGTGAVEARIERTYAASALETGRRDVAQRAVGLDAVARDVRASGVHSEKVGAVVRDLHPARGGLAVGERA